MYLGMRRGSQDTLGGPPSVGPPSVGPPSVPSGGDHLQRMAQLNASIAGSPAKTTVTQASQVFLFSCLVINDSTP